MAYIQTRAQRPRQWHIKTQRRRAGSFLAPTKALEALLSSKWRSLCLILGAVMSGDAAESPVLPRGAFCSKGWTLPWRELAKPKDSGPLGWGPWPESGKAEEAESFRSKLVSLLHTSKRTCFKKGSSPWRSVEIPLKTRNKTAIWPSNPITGHIPWGNHNGNRRLYPSVHCSTIYNSQDMKQPRCPSADEWIEAVVHIHRGILLKHKKEHIWVSSNEMDKPRAYYTEWSKSERENIY